MMDNLINKLNQRQWALQLALTTGLALLFLAALLWGSQGVTPARAGPAAPTATARYVAITGSDSGNDCTAQGSPCRTIQHAVGVASPGDIIKVAAGAYNDVHSYPAPPGPYSPPSGVITQVVYISKTVAIQGGYTTTDWMSSDPDAHPTTLDAQDQGRGLYITSDISPTIAGLRITGGDATGLRGAFGDAGGGVYFSGATAVFSDSRIFDNSAEWGGGLYVASRSTVTLHSSNVSTNTAEEGAGLYVNTYSAATLDDSTVSNNVAAIGGRLNYSASPATLGARLMGPLGAPGHGGGVAAWVSSTLTIADSKVISNTAEGGGGGLWLNQSTATLYGSAVTSNTASGDGGGLLVWYESAVALDGSTVAGNAANRGAGLLLGARSVATLTNNIVADNEANNMGGGLSILGSAMNLLHNTIVENRAGDGSAVYVTDYAGASGAAALTNSILANHTVGIRVTAGSTATLESTLWNGNTTDWDGGGTIQRSNDYSGSPSFKDPSVGDYHIGPASAAIDKGVETNVGTDVDGDPRPQNDGYDIGADEFVGTIVLPGPRYVDGATGGDTTACTNPAVPCETISYALTQAGSGDEIRVAGGIYTEVLDIGISVTLKGGYTMSGTLWLPRSGETIVDADGADSPVIGIGNDAVVTIEGFIVQGANHFSEGGGIRVDLARAVVSDTVVRNNAASLGGGVWVEQWEGHPGSLLLINSSLLTNTASQGGGGLSGSGWPTVTLDNVEVRGNTAGDSGGGLGVQQVTITNSRIVSNTAGNDGGGIWAWAAHIYTSEISGNLANGASDTHGGGLRAGWVLHLQDSVVSHNRVVAPDHAGGSGIVASGAEVTIINTRISGNEFAESAIALYECVFTITNSLVVNNDGGGIIGDDIPESGTLMNVTIAGNEDKGIRLTVDDVRITNSILWGNAGGDIDGDGSYTVAHSDIGTGDTTGIGNISADPLFVNAINGDYRLQVGSPCVDKGTSVGAPAADIVGTPRDAAPDMGAYEWTGFRIFLPLTLRNVGP